MNIIKNERIKLIFYFICYIAFLSLLYNPALNDNQFSLLVSLIVVFILIINKKSLIKKIIDVLENNIDKKVRIFSLLLALLNSCGLIFYWSSRSFFAFSDNVYLKILGLFISIFAFLFVYKIIHIFNIYMYDVFKDAELFKNNNRYELVVMFVLFIFLFVLSIYAFYQSPMFYAYFKDGPVVDIVYTSDSQSFIYGNVFIDFFHYENDLRQPLFALFAIPFFGIVYLISFLLGLNNMKYALLLNFMEILLLIISVFILSKSLTSNYKKRICFVIFMCCTYPTLLFSIMIEQYIVPLFWLACNIYLKTKNKQNILCQVAMCGTMISSIVLIPYLYYDDDYKKCIKNSFIFGLIFIIFLLLGYKVDIFNISKINELYGFTGVGLPFVDKLKQFSVFVKTCFLLPRTEIIMGATGLSYWAMSKAYFSFTGVALLVMCIFKYQKNKKSIIYNTSIIWILFSIFLLLLVGWGTAENGQVLYTLYFGWAYYILIFAILDEYVLEKRKYFVFIFIILLLFIVNLYGLHELIQFMHIAYPISPL